MGTELEKGMKEFKSVKCQIGQRDRIELRKSMYEELGTSIFHFHFNLQTRFISYHNDLIIARFFFSMALNERDCHCIPPSQSL